MPYQNEMLDEWVGGLVLMGLTVAPEIDDEYAEKMGEDPTAVRSHVAQSMHALYRLLAYDEVGITIRMAVNEEERPPLFVPWGAVLRLELIAGPEGEQPPQN